MKPFLALALATALLALPAAAMAQEAAKPAASAPKSYDFTDGAPQWVDDANIHAFYQATIEAFAHGADHLDRAAYEKRSHEIFRALALAHNMPADALQDHLKAIPGEMVKIVTRDPQTLASYDNFVIALFGPQKSGPGSIH